MKIIALSGKSNIGKTYTLKKLIKILLNDINFAIVQKDIYIYNKLNIRGNADTFAKFRHKPTNALISITTKGDKPTTINRAYKKLCPCNIFVCACHTSGATVNYIEHHPDASSWEIVTKSTVESSDKNQELIVQEIYDTAQAELLYNEIIRSL